MRVNTHYKGVASAHARGCSFCCVYGQLVAIIMEMTERRFLGDGRRWG
jgi:hypothetical protein